MNTLDSRERIGELPNPERLAETFVDLASSAIEGADVVDLFIMLSERTAELLPVEACGLLIVDATGSLQVIGASSHSAEILDLFQIQNDEGPCRECCSTGMPVTDTSLDPQGPWPRFAELVRHHGFAAVYAIPLAAQGVSFGALNLFAENPLEDPHLVVAQALADAATMALLQSDPHHDLAVVSRQLFAAIEARNTIEQAKGVLSQRHGVAPQDALRVMRDASRQTHEKLSAVATRVVQGRETPGLKRALDQDLV